MSRYLLAANWKMHLSLTEAQALTSEIASALQGDPAIRVPMVLGVPAPYLQAVHHLVKAQSARLAVAAQNIHQAEQGAFTGETSAGMAKSCGATYAILGHSERRQYFGEDDALLAQKLDRSLASGLRPIFCIGETLAEREANQTLAVVETQLRDGSFHLSADQYRSVVLAYEPVWAIGTGKTASPQQAQEVHAAIRGLLAKQYGNELAQQIPILYGGSVKGSNAAELFAQPDIDGGLVGGASLSSSEFLAIVRSFPA